MNIKKTVGLSAELQKKLTNCQKDKDQVEKKLKRKLTDVKAQAKARKTKLAKFQKIMSEAGETIKHSPGRPRIEETFDKFSELAEAI